MQISSTYIEKENKSRDNGLLNVEFICCWAGILCSEGNSGGDHVVRERLGTNRQVHLSLSFFGFDSSPFLNRRDNFTHEVLNSRSKDLIFLGIWHMNAGVWRKVRRTSSWSRWSCRTWSGWGISWRETSEIEWGATGRAPPTRGSCKRAPTCPHPRRPSLPHRHRPPPHCLQRRLGRRRRRRRFLCPSRHRRRHLRGPRDRVRRHRWNLPRDGSKWPAAVTSLVPSFNFFSLFSIFFLGLGWNWQLKFTVISVAYYLSTRSVSFFGVSTALVSYNFFRNMNRSWMHGYRSLFSSSC